MKEKAFDLKAVQPQKFNIIQIRKTYQKALLSLKSANKILDTDPDGSFTMSYEAMLKVSLALMFSYGYRPRVQLGHHKTLVQFSSHVLGERFLDLTTTYDKMRDKRNKLIYDTSFVSKTEADRARRTAARYLKVVAEKIIENNPQLKIID